MKKLCKICKTPLTRMQRSYCCKECSRIGSNKISCEHARKNKIVARTKKICPDCGGALDGQQRVRCLACTEIHKKEYAKKWRAANHKMCLQYMRDDYNRNGKKRPVPYEKKPGHEPKVLRPCRSMEIWGHKSPWCTGYIKNNNIQMCQACATYRNNIEACAEGFEVIGQGGMDYQKNP